MMVLPGLLTNILNSKETSEEQGFVEISGVYTGIINNGGNVNITASGRLNGRIEAEKVEIAGVVDGDVIAEKLIIHSSGKLYYNELNYQQLLTKDGCVIASKGKEQKNAQKAYVAQNSHKLDSYSGKDNPEMQTEGNSSLQKEPPLLHEYEQKQPLVRKQPHFHNSYY
ncbi:MAG: polymer-forming cytoskeletal protein [Dethiobacteria bacterium]|jgi:cytoskeletal protein CcmA (bactofilin family)|nr:polymer-forming cytoskeletal protein [Bacillota bacterium]